jgi:two-component system OmpR family sensor kinase
MRPHSLTRRLLLQLIAAQVGLIVVALAVFPFVSPYVNYADIADRSVRELLTASLRREADGKLVLDPSPALRRYAARRPTLAYAAMARTGLQVVDGSAPELAAVLERLGALVPHDSDTLETDRPGVPGDAVIVTGQPTPLGSVVMATAGDAFGHEDLIDLVDDFMPALLPIFAPLVFGTVLVVPLVVRRSMRPLLLAADGARQISVRSLDRRLPEAGMPVELMPLVAAVNAALDRLHDQVGRQRLFMANAAHELRTPVAILQARVDALPHDDAARSDLLRDVQRIRLLVEQVLLAARLGERGMAADETVELVGHVRAVVAACAPLAIRGGREIEFEASVAAVTVLGNARAIEGAVTNLIDNALRAAPAAGLITVAVHAGAVVEVRDQGPGVAPADRVHVFEPFWRKDERGPGTGLGLAIVREVARLHGGTASVDETPGGGAAFRLHLPALSGAARDAPPSHHVPAM